MSTISPRIQGCNSALNVLYVPILPDSGINMRSKHLTLFFPRHDTGDKIESELKSDEGDKIGRDRRRRLGHTLHPTYTLHPTPYTLHPTYTLNPTPNPHPTPCTVKQTNPAEVYPAGRVAEKGQAGVGTGGGLTSARAAADQDTRRECL